MMGNDELRRDLRAVVDKYNVPEATPEQLRVSACLSALRGFTYEPERLKVVTLLLVEISQEAIVEINQKLQNFASKWN